jgi:hypothetical protein
MLRIQGHSSRILHRLEVFFILLILLSQYFKAFYILGSAFFVVVALIILALGFIHLARSKKFTRLTVWLVLICIFFIVKFIIEDIELWMIIEIARQYFGWLIFYFYFSLRLMCFYNNAQRFEYIIKNLRFIVLIIVVMCAVELLFRDVSIFREIRDGSEFDRVYGIVARPSSTAVTLVSCSITLYLCAKYYYNAIVKFDKYLILAAFVALLTINSGVGVVVFFAAVLAAKDKSKKARGTFANIINDLPKLVLLLFALAAIFYLTMKIFDLENRISTEYFLILFELKLNIIIEHLHVETLLIGSSTSEYFKFGGDFALGAMAGHLGALGMITFFLASTSNKNFLNFPGIAITFISLFHYGAPFVSSGSIVFGIVLSVGAIVLPRSNSSFRWSKEIASSSRWYSNASKRI